MNQEFVNKFFEDRDETGRFMLSSYRTGKRYFVEPIGDGRMADWGSYNPSTGNIENKKGAGKFSGSIKEEESLLTKENGFDKVHYSGVGCSPFSVIEELDAKHPTVEK
jgi:hypothetical protein